MPGLANVAWAKRLTWADPRVRTLEAQVRIPVLGTAPIEMGMRGQEGAIAERLGRDACYVRMFADAFPEAGGRIDMDRVAMALAAFQRTLVSDRSPYDRWRAGDRSALSGTEKSGARVFASQCASCHSGPDFSDSRYHAIGPAGGDRGLAEITGRAADEGRFRTPGLRNVALTDPYLHDDDGSARSIEQALTRHDRIGIDPESRGAVAAFLRTLSDRAFVTDPRYALPQAACGVSL